MGSKIGREGVREKGEEERGIHEGAVQRRRERKRGKRRVRGSKTTNLCPQN